MFIGGGDSYFYAFDTKTGKEVWRDEDPVREHRQSDDLSHPLRPAVHRHGHRHRRRQRAAGVCGRPVGVETAIRCGSMAGAGAMRIFRRSVSVRLQRALRADELPRDGLVAQQAEAKTGKVRTAWDGVYTEEQAERGRAQYTGSVRLVPRERPSRRQHGAESGRGELFVSVGRHDRRRAVRPDPNVHAIRSSQQPAQPALRRYRGVHSPGEQVPSRRSGSRSRRGRPPTDSDRDQAALISNHTKITKNLVVCSLGLGDQVLGDCDLT